MRVLFVSNGHGEDLNASLILAAFRQAYPEIEVAALPIVGAGNAYRKLQVPVIVPTRTMPSGGIFYMNPLALVKDLISGLIVLTWKQIQAARREGPTYDLVVAVGDQVPQIMAYLTGRPYVAFIVSTSSYYENRLRLPWISQQLLSSPRCLQIFTRDAFTAEDLQSRGLSRAIFAGYPIMDCLTPTGTDLHLTPDAPMLALLPGSRVPEACENFKLQLQLCQILSQISAHPLQFRAALVPAITTPTLRQIAAEQGWQYRESGELIHDQAKHPVVVRCYHDAFPDILHQCDLAIGMAGTAVEQAVGLGKPVIQIPGAGPQFTYRFAEAQMRLLGPSVQTIGTKPTTPAILREAAHQVIRTLHDLDYRASCLRNGQERVGAPGGSQAIAAKIRQCLTTGIQSAL